MSSNPPDPRTAAMTDRELLAACVQAERYGHIFPAENIRDFQTADRIIAQGFSRVPSVVPGLTGGVTLAGQNETQVAPDVTLDPPR